MSLDGAEKIYDEMVEKYGTLPHPEHEPKMCEWYLKMYKYYQDQKSKR